MRRFLFDSPDVVWIFVLLLADAGLLGVTDFRPVWRPEILILLAAAGLAAISLVYARLREAPRLAGLAGTGCKLVLFTDAATVLDYILTGIVKLPLWDARFAAADRAMGLDWLGMYQWVTAHRAAFAVGNFVYFALGPEFLVLLLWLDLSGRHGRPVVLWRRFVVAASVTVVVGLVVPAVGAFVFFDLPVAKVTDYVAQMAALRDGALRVIDLGDVQGLVVFPSFHAALAVICAAVAQGRWIVPVWGFNLLIVAASPAIGGHYFVDILAGILLACITVGLVHERPRGTVPV
jgi:hypothetical protein